MTCLQVGSGIMKCVEEQPTCVPGNGECGGPGRRTETCCGDAKCVSSVGGGVMTCLQVHELADELNSVQTENSSLSASSSAGMSAAASMLELASSQGCWSSNGFICEYAYGQATGCHETAAECVSATGKAPLCYEYNGAICVKVEGDTPSSNCHGTEALCEQAHRPFTPLKLLETIRGTCNPDPHCSWKGDRCHCCYNGGCDYEDACKCGHGQIEDSAVVSQDSAELNSTGLSAAAAGLWCTPIADKCGGTLGPFKWHKKCCGNAKCQKLFGSPDGTMKCVQEQPEQQCVPLHRECGGPGRRTEACCQGTCERQRGGGVMKCVDKQCAAPHAECGGPGRLTLPCCRPELSCKAQFFRERASVSAAAAS